MNKKKTYEAPALAFYHVGIPSILAGTNDVPGITETGGTIGTGGNGTGGDEVIGDDDPVLSRRGGFWDDDF